MPYAGDAWEAYGVGGCCPSGDGAANSIGGALVLAPIARLDTRSSRSGFGSTQVGLHASAVFQANLRSDEKRRMLLKHIKSREGFRIDHVKLTPDGDGSARDEGRVFTEINKLELRCRSHPTDESARSQRRMIACAGDKRAIHEQTLSR